MSVIKMTDLDLSGKRVFIRADLNVPVKDGKVTSDARIRATIPTLKLALEKGAKVMVTSHLGRPTEGEFKPEDSLQPVVDYLNEHLDVPVRLERNYLNGLAKDRRTCSSSLFTKSSVEPSLSTKTVLFFNRTLSNAVAFSSPLT